MKACWKMPGTVWVKVGSELYSTKKWSPPSYQPALKWNYGVGLTRVGSCSIDHTFIALSFPVIPDWLALPVSTNTETVHSVPCPSTSSRSTSPAKVQRFWRSPQDVSNLKSAGSVIIITENSQMWYNNSSRSWNVIDIHEIMAGAGSRERKN